MSKTLEPTTDVKPEIVFVFELVQQVYRGAVRIPHFHRPFVWRRPQMRDLLDSVRRHYPIGSLLIWETGTPVSSLDLIGPIAVPKSPSQTTAQVLDGHQRLSTLVGVLLHDEERFQPDPTRDPGCWSIWYDAKTDSFEHLDEKPPQPWHFPMWKLMHTFEFLEECKRLIAEGGAEAQEYVDKVQELAEIFKSYKIPIIRIKDTGVRQAVEIFARLNSKGERKTADQILSALTYEEGAGGDPQFSLAQNIDRLLDEMGDSGFGEIDRNVVLRAILAALGEDVHFTDWTRIFMGARKGLRRELPRTVEETRISLGHAIKFLHGQGVFSHRLLPYSLQLVLLSVFFRECPNPSPSQKSLLERWFWVSSFTSFFASGNLSRTRDLVEEFRRVAADSSASELQKINLEERARPFPSTFDARSARARTFVLELLSLKPRSWNGEVIGEPWRLLSSEGHRGLSRLVDSTAEGRDSKELLSSPTNRILNVTGKSAQAKSWLLDLDPSVRDEVLLSHGIPPTAFPALENGDHDSFLRQRLDYLIELDERFMKERGVVPPIEKEPRPSPIDTEED